VDSQEQRGGTTRRLTGRGMTVRGRAGRQGPGPGAEPDSLRKIAPDRNLSPIGRGPSWPRTPPPT